MSRPTEQVPATDDLMIRTPACLAVHENGLRTLGRGGRLALLSKPCDELDDQFVTEVRFMANYLRNDGLEQWPVESRDRQTRRYALVIREVTGGAPAPLDADDQARLVVRTPPTLWVQENDYSTEYAGGRIVLVAANTTDEQREELEDLGLQGITVLVNYRRNSAMEPWPLEAADRETRRFEALVLAAAEPVAPVPDAPPPPPLAA